MELPLVEVARLGYRREPVPGKLVTRLLSALRDYGLLAHRFTRPVRLLAEEFASLLGTFVLFSAIGRGIKYAILGLLASVAGPPIRRWLIRSRTRLAAVAVVAIVVGIFLLARAVR